MYKAANELFSSLDELLHLRFDLLSSEGPAGRGLFLALFTPDANLKMWSELAVGMDCR